MTALQTDTSASTELVAEVEEALRPASPRANGLYTDRLPANYPRYGGLRYTAAWWAARAWH